MAGEALSAYEGRFKKFEAKVQWNKVEDFKSKGAGFFTNPRDWIMGVYADKWLIDFLGTADAFEAVLCHELGHHFYGGGGEQEADYYMHSCLNVLWDDEYSDLRLVNAYERIKELRTEMWLSIGFTNFKIQKINQCRDYIIKLSIEEKGYKKCLEH